VPLKSRVHTVSAAPKSNPGCALGHSYSTNEQMPVRNEMPAMMLQAHAFWMIGRAFPDFASLYRDSGRPPVPADH
jgi:hypothetical protein